MNQLTKYTRPTKYDTHPRGTLWHVEGENETYIQVSEEEVIWHPLCYVLERVFTTCTKTPRVITKLLDIFENIQ